MAEYIISSGETSSGIILNSYDSMTVLDCGTVTDTTVNSGGSMFVSTGGTADTTTVNDDGWLEVFSGGKLTGQTFLAKEANVVSAYEGAIVDFDISGLTPEDGARINDLSLIQGTPDYTLTVSANDAQTTGIYTIAEGASGFNSTLSVRNTLGESLGTLAVGTTLALPDSDIGYTLDLSDGTLSVYVNEIITRDTQLEWQLEILSSGEMCDGITIGSGGMLTVSSGGVANNTTLIGEYSVFEVCGGIINRTTFENLFEVANFFSGVANYTSMGGYLDVYGGVMNHTEIRGGWLKVRDQDAVLNDNTINGGTLTIDSGTANDTVVNSLGDLEISSYYGQANNVEVNMGGRIAVAYHGLANNTVVHNGGSATISNGGSMNSASLESGAWLDIRAGILNDFTVESGARIIISSGGSCKLTGHMTFENGAIVSVYEEKTTLDFDLTRTSAGAEALVKGLSAAGNLPLYALTISPDDQAGGTYMLAEDAADFDSAVTVRKADPDKLFGESLGTLTVGKTIAIGASKYTLNLTDSTLSVTVETPNLTPTDPVGTEDKVSWEATGAKSYIVEYSTDGFEHVISVATTGSAIDMLELPAGTYQWRVKADVNSEWAVGEAIVSDTESAAPKAVQSNEDGSDDLFFASTNGAWSGVYYAQHVGSVNDWGGTNEAVSASGKGRIQNLFFGSADPNVLCLTDADNGDALFVDDVYTDLPDGIEEQTARLYKIREIRAGAGNDVVDMTSQRFEYTGEGLTTRGGAGNDVIWANKGNNWLFGDAGNDRIVGASGNDVIVGGIGNDRMHGGGGDDVFTFCENWGTDTVEQLADGEVTLWFVSGDESKWNKDTLTYTDGENSVTVKGVTADQVTLKFGDNSSEQFAALSGMGAFLDFTSERIFEESGKGILASL